MQWYQERGILKLIRAFPEEFCVLFTYTGLAADNVIEGIFLHPDLEVEPEDELIVSFLKRYLSGCNEHGTSLLTPITTRFIILFVVYLRVDGIPMPCHWCCRTAKNLLGFHSCG